MPDDVHNDVPHFFEHHLHVQYHIDNASSIGHVERGVHDNNRADKHRADNVPVDKHRADYVRADNNRAEVVDNSRADKHRAEVVDNSRADKHRAGVVDKHRADKRVDNDIIAASDVVDDGRDLTRS
ncbi:MAG: hypothetical protein ABI658_10375 [Acidimicrobiales bacterium]